MKTTSNIFTLKNLHGFIWCKAKSETYETAFVTDTMHKPCTDCTSFSVSHVHNEALTNMRISAMHMHANVPPAPR
jgi:hypothetical protein